MILEKPNENMQTYTEITGIKQIHDKHLLIREQGVFNKFIQSKKKEKCQHFTIGPHLGPLVTQQISVLHMEHLIQSHPPFFCTMTLHCGQCIASPSVTSFCNIKQRQHQSLHTEGKIQAEV